MDETRSNLTIRVDVTNPGQFFACCGLFELAHRLWPDVEACFDGRGGFHLAPLTPRHGLELLEKLRTCAIEGLSEEERKERDQLEKRYRDLQKSRRKLSRDEEARRKELGDKARAGDLLIGEPFWLRLDWWQTEDEVAPKTWAGVQEIHKVARSLQDSLKGVNEIDSLFEFACVPRLTAEYQRESKSREAKKAAPFCFDARLFVHSLDVGFSLDVQGIEMLVYSAVELLALIGLQRFRPLNRDRHFDYWLWLHPLPIAVATAVACGAVQVEGVLRHRFGFRFRDDRRRYKAFGYANLIKGE